MAKDRDALLRNLIAGYGDSIRLSDIKANIAGLFVAIMMGTVLGFRDRYPRYLSVPALLAPIIVIFFNLLASVYPRFPREGRKRFPILRNSKPEDFELISDPAPDYPPGRVPYRHGDDRGCGGAVVRGVALRRGRSGAGPAKPNFNGQKGARSSGFDPFCGSPPGTRPPVQPGGEPGR